MLCRFSHKNVYNFKKNNLFKKISVKTLILLFRKKQKEKTETKVLVICSIYQLSTLLSRSISCKNPSFRAFFRILLSSLLILSLWSWKLWKFFFFYVIDFTLFDISFVFFWNIIFFLGFSFGTGSDLYHFFSCHFTFCFYITCFIASNKTAIGGQ